MNSKRFHPIIFLRKNRFRAVWERNEVETTSKEIVFLRRILLEKSFNEIFLLTQFCSPPNLVGHIYDFFIKSSPCSRVFQRLWRAVERFYSKIIYIPCVGLRQHKISSTPMFLLFFQFFNFVSDFGCIFIFFFFYFLF